MERWQKADWLILGGIVLVAAFFRLWQLDTIPPGFQFDEAYNAADALRVVAGERPLFFEDNGGREALHIYLIAPFVAALGATAFALHIAAALIGIVTVALSYVFWRRVLPAPERRVAALAALLMAISYWHIHFSRYGIRAILMPLMLTLTFYCVWQVTTAPRRAWVQARAAKNWHASAPNGLRWSLLGGVALGLSAYAHPAARFMPVMVVLWFAWCIWQERRAPSPLERFAPLQRGLAAHPLAMHLALIAVSAFIVFLPLGYYFVRHPDSFFGHPTVVAITDQRVNEGSVLAAFAENVLRVVGMFFVRGDEAWIHNLAGRPVFDWAVAIFFAIGLALWARKLLARERIAVLLLIWIPIMLLPSLLSDAAPNFSRAIGSMPALFVLPAWGLHAAYSFARARVGLPSALLRAATALVVLFSALSTYQAYFIAFPSRPELYTAYDLDKLDAAQHLRALSQNNRIYLPPLWARHATFALLTRDAGFQSFDNGEVMVLPARDGERGMVYAFPAEADRPYMDEFERTYGALAQRRIINDARGEPLLIEYHIAARDLPPSGSALPRALPVAPQVLVDANFGDEIQFVGYRIAAPQNADQPYQLTLVWQAKQRMAADYTLFIHLNDASGRRVAQRDRRPGNGSYPTNAWQPGDIVIETYALQPKDASGRLHFAVGWYQRESGARLSVRDASGRALDDKLTFPAEATR